MTTSSTGLPPILPCFGIILVLHPESPLLRCKNTRKLLNKLFSSDISSGSKGSNESFLRRREKEGLQGEVNDMTDASDATSFRVKFNLLKVSTSI